MSCNVFDISARGSFKIVDFDSHRSFTLGPARTASSDIVLKEEGWTLFSYDMKRAEAVFLDIGAAVDLSRVPFSYLKQFELAKRQALVPFADLFALAEVLPEPGNIVQLFNTGHCGSTLLHHVFNRVPGVWCISEPVYFVNMALERDKVEPMVLERLMRAGFKFLSRCEGASDAALTVVKHFSQSTTQLRTLFDAQPAGRCLFLYRDAKGWTNSVYHFAQKVGGGMEIGREAREFIWWILSGNSPTSLLDGLVDLDAERVTFDQLAAVAWALHMWQYQEAVADGVPLLPIRYNELVADREASLRQIFRHCGLNEADVSQTLEAFEADSQEGTRTARSIAVESFGAENYQRVLQILAHPRITLDPDMILDDGVGQ